MTKSILCPIDFTDSSARALKWAVDLSAQFNCHLTVLYPYRLLHATKGDVTQLKQKNEEQAVKKFEALQKSHLNGKNLSFDFSPEVGFTNDRVEYHVRKNSVLMLVISESMNLASKENQEEFIEHLNVPVLLVP